MTGSPAITTSADVRANLVRLLRRDLIGPLPPQVDPADADLECETLNDHPSRWYLAGFIAPADESKSETDVLDADEGELDLTPESADDGAGGAAGDTDPGDVPAAKPRRLPSSLGITVLLPPSVQTITAHISWGDYVTVPRLAPEDLLESPEDDAEGSKRRQREIVDWERKPKARTVDITIETTNGPGPRRLVPDSASEQRPGGGLEIATHTRLFEIKQPGGGTEKIRAVTVFLTNRRAGASIYRRYRDLSFAFQARIELVCEEGFRARNDLSSYNANDIDLRIADLHYRDVCAYAIGRNVAADWQADPDGKIRRVWTNPLPLGEVERVVPNESADLKAAVTFGMEDLAELAATSGDALKQELEGLPRLYVTWIESEKSKIAGLAARRHEAADSLILGMDAVQKRIAKGVALLEGDARARLAFRIMNLAIARAQRRREAKQDGDPAAQKAPTWRPFQLAFVLLNLAGIVDKRHIDRETVDLLFFPTGGGKTEAYLGLAAFTIAHRRLSGRGLVGAGVTVIMRYTLRLLTLDQLGRAAAVMCALELMRDSSEFLDKDGQKQLGDWPIEIGLWVGSDASPNKLGGRGDTGDHTAVTRVRRYKKSGKHAPAPIKICPWCQTAFNRQSFSCTPNDLAPTNLEIRCANPRCDFTRDRPLPVLTVDEPIYRRLPAFLIATVDKFASLPWEAKSGAFFGHVDRADRSGFYGAAEPRVGTPLGNGWALDPPDLIVQDELHLISGPLGTVAGLYETAVDALATRTTSGARVRPKIVASTATVRRASAQILALFDRASTCIFPAPGIDRTDSFFAQTKAATDEPARWYVGLAAQGRGPKLVFMRALRTLMSGAAAAFEASGLAKDNPADPYMSTVCYFNALRELGGARRIVEEEVRSGLKNYGAARRRGSPGEAPFADRNVKLPLELTSRVSTDDVAEAKELLAREFPADGAVDVAMATNMISVGLDITRLGLMVVQGQPKTASEYIQATSRVGRNPAKPGLVVTILNLHKPRDLAHYEDFGTFHRTFYRAVEATSVTPWAARALDRALAAIVVAIARHGDANATPERAASEIVTQPAAMERVVQTILSRAPAAQLSSGKLVLEGQIRDLISAWAETALAQSSGGIGFCYAKATSAQRLLHAPLEPGLENLSAAHQRFQAGRSMRDVEPTVRLKVKDPSWGEIHQAEDV